MFLEEEVYRMLNWGFAIVIVVEFFFVIRLWISRKFDKGSFMFILTHIIFFFFAGYNLLIAINTLENEAGMGSEIASFRMGIAGVLWALSVLFLLISLVRLTKAKY